MGSPCLLTGSFPAGAKSTFCAFPFRLATFRWTHRQLRSKQRCRSAARAGPGSEAVADILLLSLIILCFALAAGYGRLCDRL